MRLRLFVIGLAVLAVPLTAAAKQVTTLDFRNGQTAGKWQVSVDGLISPGPQGLHVTADQPVVMYRNDPLPHPVDVVELTIQSAAPVQIVFLWHPHNVPAGQFVQLPVNIPASSIPQTHLLPLDRYPQWEPNTDSIGVAFGPGTDLEFTSINLIRWNSFEKLQEAWLSFWSFDVFTRYSINFLWGPLLAFTPHTRMDLFSQLPPFGWSFNRVLYPFMVITMLGALVFGWIKRHNPVLKRRAMLAIVGVLAGSWLLFDLRMGLEILSYAKTDYETYVSRPSGQKQFRYMDDFHDMIERAKKYIHGKDRFGFISDSRLLLDSSIVYEMYPAMMVLPGEDQTGVDTWLLYMRPGLILDPRGRLVDADGTVLTPPGRILERLGPSGAVFTTAPETPPA